MSHPDLIVVGASAGGATAIDQLVSALPGEVGAALLSTRCVLLLADEPAG
jgi:chemotaxis response regulator CheB